MKAKACFRKFLPVFGVKNKPGVVRLLFFEVGCVQPLMQKVSARAAH